MRIADSARRGARLLRWISILVAASEVFGHYLQEFDEHFTRDGGFSIQSDLSLNSYGWILWAITSPIAVAVMIFGFSYVLENSIARLNLNIVLAHESATSS